MFLGNAFRRHKGADTETVRQTINANLHRFMSLEDYSSEQIHLFKQFQVLLQAKAYGEADEVLTTLLAVK